MLQRLRPKVTYANVTSTLALFLALTTGTAYAANEWTGANIVNGTITTADIKNGTITGADVQDASLRGVDIQDGYVSAADIADNSLTGAEIADGSLTGSDIANGSINGDAKITDNTITTYDLADNSVDSDEVLDFGLTNEDVGILFAQVAADGTMANSSGGATSERLGTGTYEVSFGRNISACGFIATQGEAGTGGAPGAILGVTDRNANVNAAFVAVRAADGAFVDRAFTLVVVC